MGTLSVWIARLLPAAILFLAAGLKTAEISQSPDPNNYLLGQRDLSVLLIECEFALGFWLVWGHAFRCARLVSILSFSLFACYSFAIGSQGKTSCGCFGVLSVTPWTSFLIDIVVVGVLIFCKPIEVKVTPRIDLAVPIAIATMAFVLVTCGHLETTSLTVEGEIIDREKLIVVKPDAWVGQRLPLAPHIKSLTDYMAGQWTLILYHHDCEHCRKFIDSPLIRNDLSVLLVQVPPISTADRQDAAKHHCGNLDDSYRWFVESPLTIKLTDGVVTDVMKRGEISF